MQSRRDQVGLRRQNLFMYINITLLTGEWIYRSDVSFGVCRQLSLLVLPDTNLYLCFNAGMLNLTPKTKIYLYHEVQLNSIMVYNIAKFCQKCQKLRIIFCLFRKLCCLFSLFFIGIVSRNVFLSNKKPLSSFETVLYPCGNMK